MSNTITDLREHLFATLRGLRDKESPMEIDRAKAISDVAQTIINSAKVEIDHMRVTGAAGSGFLTAPHEGDTTTATGVKTVTRIADGATRTRHTLR
jgi:hypothetical protein